MYNTFKENGNYYILLQDDYIRGFSNVFFIDTIFYVDKLLYNRSVILNIYD